MSLISSSVCCLLSVDRSMCAGVGELSRIFSKSVGWSSAVGGGRGRDAEGGRGRGVAAEGVGADMCSLDRKEGNLLTKKIHYHNPMIQFCGPQQAAVLTDLEYMYSGDPIASILWQYWMSCG